VEILNLSKLLSCFDPGLLTIDSHTAGERTRLIVDGVKEVQGNTMIKKLDFFKKNFDFVRKRLTMEPRGGSGVLAAMLTPNVTRDAKFGLIYMDAKRYPYLCGHATIGAVASLFRVGLIDFENGDNHIKIDTPSGVMEAFVKVKSKKIESITISMVPSFVLATDKNIIVPGFGEISVDLVCAGGFFAMVSVEKTGKKLSLKNKSFFIELGMKIISSANEQLNVFHPERPEVKTVDVVEFYDPENDTDYIGKNMVIYGESNLDRSPCGTGTSAKLTLMHYKGLIDLNQKFSNFSPLGTSFDAKIIKKEKIGEFDGITAEITGNAQVTGIHNFVLQQSDPFPEGFLIQ
jgi:proline racemase